MGRRSILWGIIFHKKTAAPKLKQPFLPTILTIIVVMLF